MGKLISQGCFFKMYEKYRSKIMIAEIILGIALFAIGIAPVATNGCSIGCSNGCSSANAIMAMICGVLSIATGSLGIWVRKKETTERHKADIAVASISLIFALIAFGLGIAAASQCSGSHRDLYIAIAVVCFFVLLLPPPHALSSYRRMRSELHTPRPDSPQNKLDTTYASISEVIQNDYSAEPQSHDDATASKVSGTRDAHQTNDANLPGGRTIANQTSRGHSDKKSQRPLHEFPEGSDTISAYAKSKSTETEPNQSKLTTWHTEPPNNRNEPTDKTLDGPQRLSHNHGIVAENAYLVPLPSTVIGDGRACIVPNHTITNSPDNSELTKIEHATDEDTYEVPISRSLTPSNNDAIAVSSGPVTPIPETPQM